MLLAVAAGPAEAHTKTFPSAVSISFMSLGPGSAFGQVSSGKTGCFAFRTVKLYNGSQEIGETTSTSTGSWTINGTFGGSTYSAGIEKVTIKRNATHRHRCAADYSDPYTNF